MFKLDTSDELIRSQWNWNNSQKTHTSEMTQTTGIWFTQTWISKVREITCLAGPQQSITCLWYACRWLRGTIFNHHLHNNKWTYLGPTLSACEMFSSQRFHSTYVRDRTTSIQNTFILQKWILLLHKISVIKILTTQEKSNSYQTFRKSSLSKKQCTFMSHNLACCMHKRVNLTQFRNLGQTPHSKEFPCLL